MGKTIFDQVDGKNILSKKRLADKKMPSKNPESSEHNLSDSEPEAADHNSATTAPTPSISEWAKLGETINAGFKLLKDSFENFGRNLLENVASQIDYRFQQNLNMDCDEEEEDGDQNSEETPDNIFFTIW